MLEIQYEGLVIQNINEKLKIQRILTFKPLMRGLELACRPLPKNLGKPFISIIANIMYFSLSRKRINISISLERQP